jgi:AcrR family transcriptional regulator
MTAGTPQPTTSARPRRYDTSLRRRQAQNTRHAVIEAATALFSERGWSVGIRDIARSAGVSVETVYANFGSKAELLGQVLDIAVVGDEEPVAMAGRASFAALGSGSTADRAQAAAELNTAVNVRTAGIQRAFREAAAADPDLAVRLQEARNRQRGDVHQAGALVAGRPLTQSEADGLWAVVSVEVFELLTGSAGWSEADYQNWLAGAISRLLGLK